MDDKSKQNPKSGELISEFEINSLLTLVLNELTMDLNQWLDKKIENKKS